MLLLLSRWEGITPLLMLWKNEINERWGLENGHCCIYVTNLSFTNLVVYTNLDTSQVHICTILCFSQFMRFVLICSKVLRHIIIRIPAIQSEGQPIPPNSWEHRYEPRTHGKQTITYCYISKWLKIHESLMLLKIIILNYVFSKTHWLLILN